MAKKVITIKEARKAVEAKVERRAHAARVLDAFDKLERADNRAAAEKRSEVERKARHSI